MSNEAARESPGEEVARLRGCLNDLVSMMAAVPRWRRRSRVPF
jgi:hypothetical protein